MPAYISVSKLQYWILHLLHYVHYIHNIAYWIFFRLSGYGGKKSESFNLSFFLHKTSNTTTIHLDMQTFFKNTISFLYPHYNASDFLNIYFRLPLTFFYNKSILLLCITHFWIYLPLQTICKLHGMQNRMLYIYWMNIY